MRSLKYSETDGKRLFKLNDDLAKSTSPQRWFYGSKWEESEPEREATRFVIKEEIKSLLEGGPFRDLIERL